MTTDTAIYLLLAGALLAAAYLVFRHIVRRDYLQRGRLTWPSSFLQLLVFAGLMGFPYLFNPPDWPWFWRLDGPAGPAWRIAGLALITLGFVVALGTMLWFGLRRAFGLEATGLVTSGPYRLTRNPQILGGYLLVIGIAVQWPGWQSAGWVMLYGLIGHAMIVTEEEFLRASLGEEYQRYSQGTPRYLRAWPWAALSPGSGGVSD